MKDKQLLYMPISLTFISIVFVVAKLYFNKFCLEKQCMTSLHKIVIKIDIGMLLT